MFILEGAGKPEEINTNIRRLLLCGNSGEGKTYQAISTTPNPIYCDFDNGLTDPRLKNYKFQHIKFYDPIWCDKVFKKSQPCNAFLEFLRVNGMKFAPEQTLIIDSLSMLTDNLQEVKWSITPTNSSKEKDGFAFWDMIKDYYLELGKYLLQVPCNVVMTAHLEEVRNKDKGTFMHYGPLVDGKFKQRIGQFFSDVVRIKTTNKPTGDKVVTEYKWQVKPDSDFPMAKSRSAVDKMFVEANFKSLLTL